ncbi:kinase-like domain-containing protein [Daedaleopsis nitida]|nr:kinase-like domain-containing protein [Daedaleopsis nitida]
MPVALPSIPDFADAMIGRYRLIQKLGSGAYGVVYKVIDTLAPSSSSAEPVYHAMKVVRKAGRSAEDLVNFQREIALHSALVYHPNIVRLHEVDEDLDYFYIVLEYCPGGDLFDLIVRSPYVMCGDAVQYLFLSLIDAVQACHDSGIAHRDIKPENVLVSEDGMKVFLADFGVATDQHQCEDFGAGTSTYMAPECHGPYAYCPRASDIWALGVVFLNLTCELNPWAKATLEDPVFVRFLERRHTSSRTAHLSEGARAILRRMLEVDPNERITLPELRELVFNLDAVFAPEPEPEPELEYQQVALSAVHGNLASAQPRARNPTLPPGLGLTRASNASAPFYAHSVVPRYPPGLGLTTTSSALHTRPLQHSHLDWV